MYIFSYNFQSESAKSLASALNVRRIKTENSTFVGDPSKTILNWGSSQGSPEVNKCKVINRPDIVAFCTNKLKFFRHIYSINKHAHIPTFTDNQIVAQGWLENGHIVVGRETLTGHSGEGIVIFEGDVPIPKLPLYTRYYPKKDEYRIHLVRDKSGNIQIFDMQRKARDKEIPDEEVNWRVRNHSNGFVYVRENVNPPSNVIYASKQIFGWSGLDFGAVDVIYNAKYEHAIVLEINTAPGLTGTTLENYTQMIKENFLD